MHEYTYNFFAKHALHALATSFEFRVFEMEC